SSRWAASAPPAAPRRCGCWSPTTAPAASTSTSAGSPPAASSTPSGRRTHWRSSCSCQNPGMADELLEIADELYALTLPEFTPARDAKAKELKGTDLAAPVKALKKPSVAAWVVNLLVREETEQVDQVLQVGAALREAQASMSGDELRQLTRQRRQVTA